MGQLSMSQAIRRLSTQVRSICCNVYALAHRRQYKGSLLQVVATTLLIHGDPFVRYSQETDKTIVFPRERPGLDYKLNWSLNADDVTPYHDAYRNADASVSRSRDGELSGGGCRHIQLRRCL